MRQPPDKNERRPGQGGGRGQRADGLTASIADRPADPWLSACVHLLGHGLPPIVDPFTARRLWRRYRLRVSTGTEPARRRTA